MLKLFGALAITVGCTLAGFETAMASERKITAISELEEGLSIIEAELSVSAWGVKHLLERAYTATGLNIFSDAKSLLDTSGAALAWQKASKHFCGKYRLTGEQEAVINLFGDALGAGTVETQLKNTSILRNRLSEIRVRAEAEQRKNAALYKKGGFLVGIMLAVLML